MHSQVLTGDDAVAALDRLAPLLARTGAPLTAGPTWWTAWARSRAGVAEPVLVTVSDDAGGPLAAAPLAVRRGRLHDVVVGWGHEESDRAALPADDLRAADALAQAVAGWLGGRRRPWALRVEQLPDGDPVAQALARRLPVAALVPGDGCPQTPFSADRDLAGHLTRNGRKALNQARNRLARSGLEPRFEVARTPDRVRALLPDVVDLRRRRDHALGRPAALDRPHRAAFYTGVALALAAEERLELTTTRIDGRLAAYVLALRDGPWLRLWDGRVDPAWDAWSLGRVVDLHVLEQALADPGLEGLDWMRGEEDYKRRAASQVLAAQHLLAASGRVVATATAAPGVVTDGARTWLHAHPRVRQTVQQAKRTVLSRGR